MVEAILIEEIIAEIGKYLDFEDILNCCLVSTQWRNALNLNRIWSVLCAEVYDVDTSEKNPILTELSQVKPCFVLPQSTCDRLHDLCAWRIRFIQEVRINRNWKTSNFTLTRFSEDSLYLTSNLDFFVLNDDFLVVFDSPKKCFKIWRLIHSTYNESDAVVKTSIEGNLQYVHSIENGFIYVQKSLLVFIIISEDFTFKQHRVIINEDNSFAKNIPTDEDITSWYNKKIKTELNYTYYCSQKYFAAFSSEFELKLHIWDYNGIKVKEIDISKYNQFLNFVPKKNRLNFFIVTISSEDISIQSASCSEETGRMDFITGGWKCIMGDKDIKEVSDTGHWTIHLRNLDDIKLIKNVTRPELGMSGMTILSRRYFAFIKTIGYRSEIKIINGQTMKFEGTIKTEAHAISLNLIKNDMLLVQTDSLQRIQLWNINTRRQIYWIRLPILKSFHPNNLNTSKTKYFDRSSSLVYNFW